MAVLEGELNTRGVVTLTNLGLLSRMRKARDPEGSNVSDRPSPVPQLPQPAPDPKLKVRYHPQTGQPLEHVVCEKPRDDIPYQTWHTRPMSELDEVRRQIECAD